MKFLLPKLLGRNSIDADFVNLGPPFEENDSPFRTELETDKSEVWIISWVQRNKVICNSTGARTGWQSFQRKFDFFRLTGELSTPSTTGNQKLWSDVQMQQKTYTAYMFALATTETLSNKITHKVTKFKKKNKQTCFTGVTNPFFPV